MAFCPNSVDWGNAADWLAVIVAAVAAAIAWKLTGAANRIAKEQHEARLSADKREISHLALRLFTEFKPISVQLELICEALAASENADRYICDAEFRSILNTEVAAVGKIAIALDPAPLSKLPGSIAMNAAMAIAWMKLAMTSVDGVKTDPSSERLETCFDSLQTLLPRAARHATATVQDTEKTLSN